MPGAAGRLTDGDMMLLLGCSGGDEDCVSPVDNGTCCEAPSCADVLLFIMLLSTNKLSSDVDEIIEGWA
jgi:hypothetical protein